MTDVGRLKTRRDFLRVAGSRRKWVTPGLILQGAPRKGDSEVDQTPRLGFTCSKKVGNAVQRNRAKRRLRALAAELMPEHAVAGWDYVLIGRTVTVDRPFDALRDDLEQALTRLPTAKPQKPGGRGAKKPRRPKVDSR